MRAVYLSHGVVIIVVVIVDTEEEHPLDLLRAPMLNFVYPLPGQLANMATPIIQCGCPYCGQCSTLYRIFEQTNMAFPMIQYGGPLCEHGFNPEK